MNNADMPIEFIDANDPEFIRQCRPMKGLSKREYFAGLALQGLLAGPHAEADCGIEGLAHDAVLAADKLLAALENGHA